MLILQQAGTENPLGPTQIRALDFWIPGVAIVFTLWYYKNTRPDRIFHFWEGLAGGPLVLLCTAFCSATLLYFYLTYINQPLLTDYIARSIVYAQSLKDFTIRTFGEAGYKNQLNGLAQITPGTMWKDEFAKKLIYGIFVIPVAAMLLRKRDLNSV